MFDELEYEYDPSFEFMARQQCLKIEIRESPLSVQTLLDPIVNLNEDLVSIFYTWDHTLERNLAQLSYYSLICNGKLSIARISFDYYKRICTALYDCKKHLNEKLEQMKTKRQELCNFADWAIKRSSIHALKNELEPLALTIRSYQDFHREFSQNFQNFLTDTFLGSKFAKAAYEYIVKEKLTTPIIEFINTLYDEFGITVYLPELNHDVIFSIM